MENKHVTILNNVFKKIFKEINKNDDVETQTENQVDIKKENKKSLLLKESNRIYITDKIHIKIPTVGEILKDEQAYYSTINSLTAVPYQFMVQLDDMNIDFTKITDYELFLMLFPSYAKTDLSLIFDGLYTDDYDVYVDPLNSTRLLYSKTNGDDYQINECTYYDIVSALRKINMLERFNGKPGNNSAKQYLLEKERKRQKRNAKKKYEPYLENLVIGLVNSPEFKYNYDETMDMSIYRFNQSFKQIKTRITFDKTMIGVYAGTVDTTKISDKSCLSWLPIK